MDCLRCCFLLFGPIQISIGLPTICSFRCAQILEKQDTPANKRVFSVVFPCPLCLLLCFQGGSFLVDMLPRLHYANGLPSKTPGWIGMSSNDKFFQVSSIWHVNAWEARSTFLFWETVKISKQKLVGMFPSTISLKKSSQKWRVLSFNERIVKPSNHQIIKLSTKIRHH